MKSREKSPKSKAVFLDRDGTLIEDRGHLNDKSQVVFYRDTVDSLLRLQEEFDLFIVTNQPGIARNILSWDDVNRVNGYVCKDLARSGVHLKEVYVCPHERSDNCICLKPKPHFLHKAAEDYDIDLAASFTVGDHPHDAELARGVGGQGIYVLTGHGDKHLPELETDTVVVSGIGEAADWILQER